MHLILLLLIFCAACTNPPYRGNDVLGADAFVMDSYKIREGKFAILEMEGKEFCSLPEELLEEYTDEIAEGDLLNIALYHPSRSDLSLSIQAIGATVGYRVTDGKIILP